MKQLRSSMAQILATTAKNILVFGYGLTVGFPTLLIPALQTSEDPRLSLTAEGLSWIGSLNNITVPLGSVLSGIISQKYGRIRSMQVINIPFLASWIMLYYANSVEIIYANLALTGFAGGLLEAPVLTFVSEISEPRLRGILSASTPLSVVFGVFVIFALGSFFDWRTISAICVAAPIVGFMVLFFVPESPHWLLSKNRFEDSRKALCWLRGWTTKELIQEEYNALAATIKPESGRSEAFCSFNVKNYFKRTFILPFLLITFVFAAGNFSGVTTLSTYSVNIFNSFGAPINAYYANLILGLAQFVGIIVCTVLIHYTGKRPLVFSSILGSSLLFGGVGLYGYFYLGVKDIDNGAHDQEQFQELPNHSWLPMACFIGGSFISYIGQRVLPWVLIGEVYSNEVRGLASGISTSLNYLFGFLSTKTFYDFVSFFTLSGSFVLYGAIGIFQLIVLYFFLPETEGWTLAEVEEHFAGLRNLIKAGKKKRRSSSEEGARDNPVSVECETK